MDHRIELVGRPDMEVVTLPFGLRQIDHPDRPGEPDRLDAAAAGEPSCIVAGSFLSPVSCSSSSMLPASAGHCRLVFGGPAQSLAAVTVPE